MSLVDECMVVLDFVALPDLTGKGAGEALASEICRGMEYNLWIFCSVIVHLGSDAFDMLSREAGYSIPSFVVRNPFLPKKSAFAFLPSQLRLTKKESISSRELVAAEFKSLTED